MAEVLAPDAVFLANPRPPAPPAAPRRLSLVGELDAIPWRVGFVAGALYWGFSRRNFVVQVIGVAAGARLLWELATKETHATR